MAESAAYVPGVCNINHQEIASRRKAGYFGLALSIVAAGVLFALDINRFARLLLFVPLFIAAIGFLQAKNKFCVGYGAAGMQNAAEGSTTATQVSDSQAVATDKKRARKMNVQATGIAVLVTAIFLAL